MSSGATDLDLDLQAFVNVNHFQLSQSSVVLKKKFFSSIRLGEEADFQHLLLLR